MTVLRSLALLMALAAPALWAAEEQAEHAGPPHEMLWRVVNFAILAGLLGYFIGKNGGPYFAARRDGIQKEIADAKRQVTQATERARAIEERLAGLDRQVAELRSKAKAEMAAEHERLERQAEESLRKISAQVEQDIAASAKAARQELKSYAASLAIELAEKKIAGRITPPVQQELVSGFVRSLGR